MGEVEREGKKLIALAEAMLWMSESEDNIVYDHINEFYVRLIDGEVQIRVLEVDEWQVSMWNDNEFSKVDSDELKKE